jgi:hypothetical protein
MIPVEFLTGLDVNTPSWDLFIFLFFIVATFVYGFTLGRSRIMVLLISTYMALALVKTAPFLDATPSVTVGSSPFFIIQITAFIATMLLIFFFLSNSALRKAFAAQEIQGKAWQIIAFSILHAGLLVAIVLSFVPEPRRAALLDVTQGLFGTDTALFIWAALPIAVMMFVNDPDEE